MNRWGELGCAVGCAAGGALLIAVGPGLLFGLALWSGSERTIFAREPSPDGVREARVQFDDCGAPCGWNKAVFVRPALLRSDAPRLSCRAFLGDGTAGVRLGWQGSEKLVVRHGFARENVVDAASACGRVAVEARFDPALSADELPAR